MTSDLGVLRRVRLGAVAVAIALAAACSAAAAPPKVGAPAPAMVVRTLDGQTLDLAALRGKLVAVNVWATWCAPCRAEMPMLDTFYRQHRDAGFVLVGLSADRSRDIGDVRRVMSAFAYPAALLSQAKVDALTAPNVLPMTYLVGRDGNVRAVFGGTAKPLTQADLEAAVSAAM